MIILLFLGLILSLGFDLLLAFLFLPPFQATGAQVTIFFKAVGSDHSTALGACFLAMAAAEHSRHRVLFQTITTA